MALTCASMAAEVQARCGRADDGAAGLVGTTQIARWFNEAQQDIVDRIPGLHAVSFANRTSHDTTAALRYALADITAGDYTSQAVASVWNVFYLDGQDSKRLHFVHTDEFDANWIDPTHADSLFGKPHHWTRRGGNIEIRPVCSSAYYAKDLRFDGDFYPREFSAGDVTRASDLSEGDEGLKLYALKEGWRAIGDIAKAVDCSQRYEMWMDGYERRNNRLEEWDGNLYSDDIEA